MHEPSRTRMRLKPPSPGTAVISTLETGLGAAFLLSLFAYPYFRATSPDGAALVVAVWRQTVLQSLATVPLCLAFLTPLFRYGLQRNALIFVGVFLMHALIVSVSGVRGSNLAAFAFVWSGMLLYNGSFLIPRLLGQEWLPEGIFDAPAHAPGKPTPVSLAALAASAGLYACGMYCFGSFFDFLLHTLSWTGETTAQSAETATNAYLPCFLTLSRMHDVLRHSFTEWSRVNRTLVYAFFCVAPAGAAWLLTPEGSLGWHLGIALAAIAWHAWKLERPAHA